MKNDRAKSLFWHVNETSYKSLKPFKYKGLPLRHLFFPFHVSNFLFHVYSYMKNIFVEKMMIILISKTDARLAEGLKKEVRCYISYEFSKKSAHCITRGQSWYICQYDMRFGWWKKRGFMKLKFIVTSFSVARDFWVGGSRTRAEFVRRFNACR